MNCKEFPRISQEYCTIKYKLSRGDNASHTKYEYDRGLAPTIDKGGTCGSWMCGRWNPPGAEHLFRRPTLVGWTSKCLQAYRPTHGAQLPLPSCIVSAFIIDLSQVISIARRNIEADMKKLVARGCGWRSRYLARWVWHRLSLTPKSPNKMLQCYTTNVVVSIQCVWLLPKGLSVV